MTLSLAYERERNMAGKMLLELIYKIKLLFWVLTETTKLGEGWTNIADWGASCLWCVPYCLPSVRCSPASLQPVGHVLRKLGLSDRWIIMKRAKKKGEHIHTEKNVTKSFQSICSQIITTMTIKVFPLSQTRAGFEEFYLRRLFQCHVSWAGTHRKLTWIPKIAICERCYMFETIILTIYFANLQIARASLCRSDPTRKWPEDFSITRSRRFPLRLRWGRINWYDGPPAKKKKLLGMDS